MKNLVATRLGPRLQELMGTDPDTVLMISLDERSGQYQLVICPPHEGDVLTPSQAAERHITYFESDTGSRWEGVILVPRP